MAQKKYGDGHEEFFQIGSKGKLIKVANSAKVFFGTVNDNDEWFTLAGPQGEQIRVNKDEYVRNVSQGSEVNKSSIAGLGGLNPFDSRNYQSQQ